jgi:2-polyprenyl-3-methyl-5-hydroxy-6-metoxy-1,4-benzoquinol methylase
MFLQIYRALKGLLRLPDEHRAAVARIEELQQALVRIQGEATETTYHQIRRETIPLSEQLNLALRDLSLVASRQLEFQRETRLLLGQMSRPAEADWTKPWAASSAPPVGTMFSRSVVCRQEDMENPAYPYWMKKIGFAPTWHRKRWEFMFICQALYERGLIRPGMRGLGFGVGEEPLAAYFAAEGCQLTCTDMPPEAAVHSGWVETAQHAESRETLRRPFVCPDPVFDANVQFRFCDMNDIPGDLTGYDFCWSACALEHLGSIEHGLAFIERSVDCLKPGGFAVHTTEYNLSSNDETVSEGGTVLFRRRDLEGLAARLAAHGHVMAPLDVDPGAGRLDQYLDVAPYRDEPHLKLALMGYAATSIGLIVQKGPAGG